MCASTAFSFSPRAFATRCTRRPLLQELPCHGESQHGRDPHDRSHGRQATFSPEELAAGDDLAPSDVPEDEPFSLPAGEDDDESDDDLPDESAAGEAADDDFDDPLRLSVR